MSERERLADPSKAKESADGGEKDRAGGPRKAAKRKPKEIGGPKGPEPTRYGDWERKGRCVDF